MIAAFIGGLLSFLSPCVLPLVPAYIGYLGGTTVSGMVSDRRAALVHALVFVAGFTLVFVALGASAGAISHWLLRYRVWIQRIGGALVALLGLHTMGILRLPFLYQERRLQGAPRQSVGVASAFVLGVSFSAGWVPCVGPILAGILLLAGSTQTVAQGAGLLFVYSMGLGLPFVVVGLLMGSLRPLLQRANRHLGVISVLSGLLLVAIGVAIAFDLLKYVSDLGGLFG